MEGPTTQVCLCGCFCVCTLGLQCLLAGAWYILTLHTVHRPYVRRALHVRAAVSVVVSCKCGRQYGMPSLAIILQTAACMSLVPPSNQCNIDSITAIDSALFCLSMPAGVT
jgi:hypothetical protein